MTSRYSARLLAINIFSLFLFLLCVPSLVFSQPDTPVPGKGGSNHDLKFEFAFDIGGQPSAISIQDRQGFIWVTSFFKGLVRFDGSEVKYFRAGPDFISSDFTTQLFEDSEGIIWIGTSHGLNRYDKTTDSVRVYLKDPDKPAQSIVGNSYQNSSSTIIEDRDGLLWFGTESGLSSYQRKDGLFTNYVHEPGNENSLPGNIITTVFEDSEGFIWVGTKNSGAARIDKKNNTITRHVHTAGDSSSLPPGEISVILEDQGNSLWLATLTHGLFRYSEKEGNFTHISNDDGNPYGLPKMEIRQICLLQSGQFVITGSIAGPTGLVIFDPSALTTTVYHKKSGGPHSLSSNNILQVLEDSSNILWIVHSNGKVDKHDPASHRFELFRHNPLDPKSVASDMVMPVYEDQKGNIWIGTFGAGLERYDPATGEFQHFRPDANDPLKLPHGYPCGFFEDQQGNFYVSTFSGIVLFDADTGVVKKHVPAKTNFFTIVQDHENPDVIWGVGWETGLKRLNMATGELQSFVHDPMDPQSMGAVTALRFIAEHDEPNSLWLATWGGGLDKFDTRTGRFTHHQHDPDDPGSISSNVVYDVLEDRSGRIWVATDKGLNQLISRDGHFKRYSKKHGLAINIVHNILEDNEGKLWMGTDGGLIHFDPDKEKVLRIYTVEDGLHSHDFFPTGRGKSSDGRLWFGGFNGLNSFLPGNMVENQVAPSVYMTSITQGGLPIESISQAFEILTELNLSWRDNSFEFEYVALNFTRSTKNQYQYKLEGVDDDWYQAGTKRFGRYADLPGGNYLLRIRGSNNDGVWSRPEQEVALKIHVTSPPWQTMWAYLLYFLTTVAIVYGVIRTRLQAVESQKSALQLLVDDKTRELRRQKEIAESANQAKSTFLANMSHELRTPLNAIIGFSEIARNSEMVPASQKKHFGVISRSGNFLLQLINNILDMSKIEVGKMDFIPVDLDLPSLVHDVVEMMQVQADLKGVQLLVEQSPDLPHRIHTDESKLLQILLNLLSNAIKFTKQGQVTLFLSAEEVLPDRIKLKGEVRDTGQGIKAEDLERIFQPFEQLTQVSSQQGTGLGLTITRQFVEMMDGEVRAESEPGVGTTFFFHVLVGVAADQSPSISRQDDVRIVGLAEPDKEWRILVVEDNLENQLLLRHILETAGFEVRVAGDGERAVQLFQGWHPHLIWMDIRMPVMDGHEATARIRELDGGTEVKIVAITASSYMEEHQVHVDAGYDDILAKPYQADTIFQTMTKLLGIEFITEGGSADEPISDAPPLEELPGELRQKLKKSALNLDPAAVGEVIDAIGRDFPETADGLEQLAREFRFDRILELLEKKEGR